MEMSLNKRLNYEQEIFYEDTSFSNMFCLLFASR